MNKKQKAIYKCTKNCYKMLLKQNEDKSVLRTFDELYKIFKRVFKRKNIDEIMKENKKYIYYYKNNIVAL